jgi:hypothetical protein
VEFHQQPGVMTTAPNPPQPQQGGSRLKSALILAAVAVVFGGAGALGADLAIGSPKSASPKPTKTQKPSIPTVFQAMPSPCDLLTTAQVTQFVQHPKQPSLLGKTGAEGNPGGTCQFDTSSDFLGHNRSIELSVDMYPSTAQGSGPDLAKAAFEKKATDNKGKAGTTKKSTYQTATYSQLNQLQGLGEEAYSLYYRLDDTTGSAYGYGEADVLRGNVVIRIQTSGFDEPADGSLKPPALADSDLRPGAEQMARYAIVNLNSCTACAGH